MLKYYNVENQLTERPGDCTALTLNLGSLDKSAFIDRMLKRGTSVTSTDALAVMNAIEETAVDLILQGYTLNLPLMNTSFSISGVFDGPLDTFDGNRHKLNINLTKGVLLRDAEKNVKLEKTSVPAPMPQIQEVRDSVSRSVNEKLTARGVIELRGYNLKIDGDESSCGLWFVAENGTETKAEVIIENKPSKIIAMIPDLAAGKYQVKVATQFSGGGKFLLAPKVFVYQKNLTVM